MVTLPTLKYPLRCTDFHSAQWKSILLRACVTGDCRRLRRPREPKCHECLYQGVLIMRIHPSCTACSLMNRRGQCRKTESKQKKAKRGKRKSKTLGTKKAEEVAADSDDHVKMVGLFPWYTYIVPWRDMSFLHNCAYKLISTGTN